MWVAFWGLGEPQLWDQNSVRVGYYIPPETAFFVVTYVDGSQEGVYYENNEDGGGVHVDGNKLKLDSRFSGIHTVEVVLYHDGNANGRFDQGIDSPCLDAGEPVTTGPEHLNFSRFSE